MARTKKKKNPKDDPDYRDPDVTYATTNTPGKTMKQSMSEVKVEPITDEEIKNLLAKPDWIWAGMTQPVMRMFKRIGVGL